MGRVHVTCLVHPLAAINHQKTSILVLKVLEMTITKQKGGPFHSTPVCIKLYSYVQADNALVVGSANTA